MTILRPAIAERIATLRTGRHSITERQLVMAGSFAVAGLLLVLPGVTIANYFQLWLSVALMAAITAGALWLPWRTLPKNLHLAVWFIDIAAVGLLREATGGPSSQVNALIILPVLSLALERGRLPVIAGSVATCAIYLLPVLLNQHSDADAAILVRAVFTPFVLLLTGLTVNELTTRVRFRMRSEGQLRKAQEQLLSLADAHALELAARAEELKMSSELLASVMDSATEQAIIGTDLVGTIQLFNTGAEQMVGYRAADLIGTHFAPPLRETNPVAGRAPWEGHVFTSLIQVASQGLPDVRECFVVLPNGHELPARIAATARHDDAGRLTGYMFVVIDMTQVYEVARLKDQFVSLISHELRTPLSSILGYIELIADDEDNPLSPEQSVYLTTVERNANRLLRLVGELLFTAQVESGGFSLDNQEVLLAPLLETAVESAMPVASTGGIDILVGTLASARVLGDPLRLSQACDNLISNAIKFTKTGGSVTVSLEVCDGSALIRVRDTGVGIPADEVDKLASRFFRASTATKNAVPGVGLGLTITKAIATAHGGALEVASVEREGTTFTLRLPLMG